MDTMAWILWFALGFFVMRLIRNIYDALHK